MMVNMDVLTRFRLDPRNKCDNYQRYDKCCQCNGYQSVILCKDYESEANRRKRERVLEMIEPKEENDNG